MKGLLFAGALVVLIAAACGSTESDRQDTSGGSDGSGATSGSAGSSGGKTGGAAGGGSAGSAGSGGGGSDSSAGGSSGSDSSAGGSSAGGSSAGGSSAGTNGNAPFPCGSVTCAANQYCITPCCGGPQPQCFHRGDADICPAGSVQGCNYPSEACPDVAFCCMPLPCKPPPPYCAAEVPMGCVLQGRSCWLQNCA
jgi:hypothetical protein